MTERNYYRSLTKEPGFASLPFARRQYIERRADHLPVMILYRSEADLAYTDMSMDPSDRLVGSNYGPRPDRRNYSQDARLRQIRPDAYLSTMSGTASYARLHDNIKKVTVPTLVLGGTADRGIFPSEQKTTFANSGAKDKTIAWIEGADHGFNRQGRNGRWPAAAARAAAAAYSVDGQGGFPKSRRVTITTVSSRITCKTAIGMLALLLALGPGRSDDDKLPKDVHFTTVSITPLAIEGLTGDGTGAFFTTGRAAAPTRCPVWRIDVAGVAPPVTPLQIGSIPNAAPGCNPSGTTRDAHGNFYIADANQGGVIWKLTSADMNPTSPFATGVPGTNGIAFDEDGNLWTGDGTTGLGRVWKIDAAGTPTLMFRIQPMRNSTALGGTIAGDGVGRQARTIPPGTLTVPASATPTVVAGGQDLVANGVAFDRHGNLFVADTARGAIWKITFDHRGRVTSRTGCDTTFSPDTLCLDNIFVAHPLLEGTDGIALDREGNIWNAANERNAIVAVTKDREVVEVFRNPPNAAGLRNSANPSVGNNHILELPTSPSLSGTLLAWRSRTATGATTPGMPRRDRS